MEDAHENPRRHRHEPQASPLDITEVNLDGPRAGEVLVEIRATGLCHTDEFTRSGADPEGLFPGDSGP
jgi:S-(hydroxymethyl)glutathione dehydrogenase/alcohol dehydrogenase